jgi:hypothetical protein
MEQTLTLAPALDFFNLGCAGWLAGGNGLNEP